MKNSLALKNSTVFLLAGFLLLGAAGCQPNPKTDSAESSVFDGRLTFSAKVSGLGLQSNSLAAGKSAGDTVEVILPGKRYFVPKPTPPIAREMANRSTPVQAASSDHFAFRSDDADWILENFAEADQEEVRGWLGDKRIREANSSYYSSLETMQIWGEAELQGYRLVFVRYNGDKTNSAVLTFTETPGGWKRTNALKADETFDVVFASVRNGLGN